MYNRQNQIKEDMLLRKNKFKIFIPKGTPIYLEHSFAGKGSNKKYYNSKKSKKKFGDKKRNWSKMKGYIYINQYCIEIHWTHSTKVGNQEYKIKNYERLQSKSFFYDFIEEKDN